MEDYIRGQELLKDLLILPGFQQRIAKERDNPQEHGVWNILYAYNISPKFTDVVKWYIEADELDFSLTLPVVELDQTNGVALRVMRDSTKEELLDYIEEHWTDEIRPALDYLNDPHERIPIPSHPEKDRRIYLDYLNKKKLGLTNQGVATRNNTNISRVKRVIERFKRISLAR